VLLPGWRAGRGIEGVDGVVLGRREDMAEGEQRLRVLGGIERDGPGLLERVQ